MGRGRAAFAQCLRDKRKLLCGFFAFRREIFDYMNEGEELVVEPFERLIAKRELLTVAYDGFWRNMDTFKDKMQLDEMVAQGHVPWQVWASR